MGKSAALNIGALITLFPIFRYSTRTLSLQKKLSDQQHIAWGLLKSGFRRAVAYLPIWLALKCHSPGKPITLSNDQKK